MSLSDYTSGLISTGLLLILVKTEKPHGTGIGPIVDRVGKLSRMLPCLSYLISRLVVFLTVSGENSMTLWSYDAIEF